MSGISSMANMTMRSVGVCIFGGTLALGAGFAPAAAGTRTSSVLVDFNGAYGGLPYGSLVLDKSGNLFGTTFIGGTDDDGVVYKIAASGGETVLHQFTGGTDGLGPIAGMIMDKHGNLYGTTLSGGNGCSPFGCGTVFEIAPDGTETILYAFKGGTSDGSNPAAALVADAQGNLYGTTLEGGSGSLGTVFKLAPDGTETLLHNFIGGSDGSTPDAAVIADAQGNLYGTTNSGGAGNGGTVFKIATDGTETILASFTLDGSFGSSLNSPLIMDKQGNLYGTATTGGFGNCQDGCGTVFEITSGGSLNVIYRFDGGTDGGNPDAPLFVDRKGDFYGTTVGGGSGCGGSGCGVVFKLTPKGKETTVYAFTGGYDGAQPYSPVIADKQGDFYTQTTIDGKSCTGYAVSGCGAVVKIDK
jgi:uncharacterized repeat protein (TIGR03803 family)